MIRNIILASSSARRKSLLESVGLNFEAVNSPYEEDLTLFSDPFEMVTVFSREKARAIRGIYRDHIIIAADTIVFFEGVIFGKPKDKEEALSMLRRFQGKKHTVYTGVTVLDSKTGKEVTEVVTTDIMLSHLSEREIQSYFEKTPLLDKAGAYAIQGYGATFTARVEGEYSNVVGLPMAKLREMLKEFNIYLL